MSTTPTEYYATGKRKTAIARVRLLPGTGAFTLNDHTLDEFFGGHEALKMLVKQPFAVTETNEKYDVRAKLHGGGVAAQLGEEVDQHDLHGGGHRHGEEHAPHAEKRGTAHEGENVYDGVQPHGAAHQPRSVCASPPSRASCSARPAFRSRMAGARRSIALSG